MSSSPSFKDSAFTTAIFSPLFIELFSTDTYSLGETNNSEFSGNPGTSSPSTKYNAIGNLVPEIILSTSGSAFKLSDFLFGPKTVGVMISASSILGKISIFSGTLVPTFA